MKFKEFDAFMRTYETTTDILVPSDIYMVARLDGRNFTKLTQDHLKPFDTNFSLIMRSVTKSLMESSGFSFIYAYTQSDEISLLFSLNETTFNRKIRKLISVLAGEASSEFTYQSNLKGSFDCRISQLANISLVQDYFSWRQSDCSSNCLNAYTYWTLRQNNFTAEKATKIMFQLPKAGKLNLLQSYNINYQNVPPWHKFGVGFYFKSILKEGFNPQLKETTLVYRREFTEKITLLSTEQYRYFISGIIHDYPGL